MSLLVISYKKISFWLNAGPARRARSAGSLTGEKRAGGQNHGTETGKGCVINDIMPSLFQSAEESKPAGPGNCREEKK